MATKKKKSSGNNSVKASVIEKLTEHNRDFLKADITLPLGNTALKQVHTNQWLFTELSDEFVLANWSLLAKVLNAKSNRYSGYVKNRWYIESNTITVDIGSNKAEMKLGINAFPSSYENYLKANKDYQKAFTDSQNKNNDANGSNNNKDTTNAIAGDNAVIKNGWWGEWVTNMVKSWVGSETDVLKNCKTVHEKFRWQTRWTEYNNMIYTGGSVNNLEKQWSRHKFNCGDGANYLSAFYSCCGAKTGIYLTYDSAHYIVKVEINGNTYWCDHSGAEGAYNTLRGWNQTWHGYRSGSYRGRYV